MRAVLVLPPVSEPVSLATAKAHLRVRTDAEDEYIAGRITAAREYAEESTRLALAPQTWDVVLDGFPVRGWEDWISSPYVDLPHPPILGVASVTYVDTAGVEQVLDASAYTVQSAEPWRLVRGADPWPVTLAGSEVRVRYRAGYVPALLQYADAADMDADLDHPADVFARVVTGERTGLYQKIGAAGGGSWEPSTYPYVQQIPQRAVQLILLIVGHWYNNREASVTGTITGATELAVNSLVRSLQRAKVA